MYMCRSFNDLLIYLLCVSCFIVVYLFCYSFAFCFFMVFRYVVFLCWLCIAPLLMYVVDCVIHVIVICSSCMVMSFLLLLSFVTCLFRSLFLSFHVVLSLYHVWCSLLLFMLCHCFANSLIAFLIHLFARYFCGSVLYISI